MRYFFIETKNNTGRKYFKGRSVTTKYAAERDLAKRSATPGSTLTIEAYPTVTAACDAVNAHNEPLPVFASKVIA